MSAGAGGGTATAVWVTSGEACAALGVCRRTLVAWAESGRLRVLRVGEKSQRKYDISSVLPETKNNKQEVPAGPVDAIYCRVSTRKQKPYLEKQIETLKSKYPDHEVYSDICSGINFKRKGLQALLELSLAGRLRVVRIAHKDRLCRFAYDLLEWLFKRNGATIAVEADDSHTPEAELADDVLSIITVFGARLYGSRSKRRRQASQDGDRQPVQVDPPSGSERDASDVLDQDAPDLSAEAGAATYVCGSEVELQRGGGSGKKRGRPPTVRTTLEAHNGGGAAGSEGGECARA